MNRFFPAEDGAPGAAYVPTVRLSGADLEAAGTFSSGTWFFNYPTLLSAKLAANPGMVAPPRCVVGALRPPARDDSAPPSDDDMGMVAEGNVVPNEENLVTKTVRDAAAAAAASGRSRLAGVVNKYLALSTGANPLLDALVQVEEGA